PRTGSFEPYELIAQAPPSFTPTRTRLDVFGMRYDAATSNSDTPTPAIAAVAMRADAEVIGFERRRIEGLRRLATVFLTTGFERRRPFALRREPLIES